MPFGTVVLQQDVADIIGMDFPLVEVLEDEGVLVLFREQFRFGLYFDLRRGDQFNRDVMISELGALIRRIKYHDLYDMLSGSKRGTFDKLLDIGWFPFVEIINSEFLLLADHCHNQGDLDVAQNKVLESFDTERLQHMLQRWLSNPNFTEKEPILKSGVESYIRRDFVSTIKVISTEIEGILRSSYPQKQMKKQNLKNLSEQAFDSAIRKTKSNQSLLLPDFFKEYISENLSAQFDPTGPLGKASSRHAVAHGRASADSYSGTRALQALLTLDQFIFYV